jgi:hypothetical protein
MDTNPRVNALGLRRDGGYNKVNGVIVHNTKYGQPIYQLGADLDIPDGSVFSVDADRFSDLAVIKALESYKPGPIDISSIILELDASPTEDLTRERDKEDISFVGPYDDIYEERIFDGDVDGKDTFNVPIDVQGLSEIFSESTFTERDGPPTLDEDEFLKAFDHFLGTSEVHPLSERVPDPVDKADLVYQDLEGDGSYTRDEVMTGMVGRKLELTIGKTLQEVSTQFLEVDPLIASVDEWSLKFKGIDRLPGSGGICFIAYSRDMQLVFPQLYRTLGAHRLGYNLHPAPILDFPVFSSRLDPACAWVAYLNIVIEHFGMDVPQAHLEAMVRWINKEIALPTQDIIEANSVRCRTDVIKYLWDVYRHICDVENMQLPTQGNAFSSAEASCLYHLKTFPSMFDSLIDPSACRRVEYTGGRVNPRFEYALAMADRALKNPLLGIRGNVNLIFYNVDEFQPEDKFDLAFGACYSSSMSWMGSGSISYGKYVPFDGDVDTINPFGVDDSGKARSNLVVHACNLLRKYYGVGDD